ncbi:Ada metal-binding domain-containing protein [Desulfopila aestuarii]
MRKDFNCKNCIQNFDSKQSAVNAGYRPCGRCQP